MEMADAQADTFILGQTLTTDVGDSGSRALGDVHENVRIGMMQRVADFVADVYNHQLIPSIIELNYGDASELPCYKATFKQPQDEAKMVSRDKTLFLDMKLPVSKTYLYDRYGVPVPDEDSDDLFLPPEGQGGGAGDLEPGGDITAPPKGGTSDRENRLLSLWAQRMLRLADQLRKRGQDSKADKIETEVFDKMGLADMDVDEIKGSIVMANCGTGKGGFKLGNSCAKGDKNLEKSTKTGENTNHERTGTTQQGGQGESREGFSSAAEAIRRGGSGTSSESSTPRGWRGQSEDEKTALKSWAKKNGLLAPPSEAIPASDIDGSEHRIFFDAESNEYVKLTHPGQGYGMLPILSEDMNSETQKFEAYLDFREGSPTEYLERQALHNKVFGDKARLTRIIDTPEGPSIEIRQPSIKGDILTTSEIIDYMEAKGFTPLNHEPGFYRKRDNVLVMDAHRGNLLKDVNGEVQAIDLVVHKPSKEMADYLNGQIDPPIKGEFSDASREMPTIERLSDNALQDLTGVTKEWLAPVRPHFERLAALAMSKHVSDDDFIHALEKSQKDMPELFDKLNVEALQTAFEESIGTAMLAGSVSRYEGEAVEAGSWVTLDDGRKVFLDNPHTVPDQGGSGTGGSNPIGKITKLENGKNGEVVSYNTKSKKYKIWIDDEKKTVFSDKLNLLKKQPLEMLGDSMQKKIRTYKHLKGTGLKEEAKMGKELESWREHRGWSKKEFYEDMGRPR